jgi:hypothetical protein
MHGDRLEIGGREAFYTDDAKSGSTQFVAATDIAEIAAKRTGPARATAATGGRLISLVDGKEYVIPPAGVTIGRDASSGVVVAQNEVSRKHAEVRPIDGGGGYEIRDHSANGVYVNGTRIETAAVLSRADVIRVGTEEFRFYADVAAANPAPAAPAGTPAWERAAATVTHALLYCLLIAMPLDGWLINSAAGVPFSIFWMIPLPPLVAPDPALADACKLAHFWMFVLLAALVALHAAAALRHHFVKRNDVLTRMIFGK